MKNKHFPKIISQLEFEVLGQLLPGKIAPNPKTNPNPNPNPNWGAIFLESNCLVDPLP